MSDGVKDTISGALAGTAMVVTGHPFDTLKVRMQTTEGMTLGRAFTTTLKESPLAFYKGLASPLVGISLMNSVLFWGYNQAAKMIGSAQGVERATPEKITVPAVFIAGLFAGFTCAMVEGPVDLLKCKMQVQVKGMPGNYTSVFDAGKQILTNYGIRGIYQAHTATLMRNVPANALYFGCYEWAKRILHTNKEEDPSLAVLFAAGSVAGVGYWGGAYPFDVIKSTMQTDHSDPKRRKYKNYFEAVKALQKQGGTKAFYRGFTPAMMRSIPANAACFITYEYVRKALN